MLGINLSVDPDSVLAAYMSKNHTRVSVMVPDNNECSPREIFDNMGKIYSQQLGYAQHDSKSVRELLLDALGKLAAGQLTKTLIRKAGEDLTFYSFRYSTVMNMVLEAVSRRNAILPIYILDHGFQTIQTTPFSCPWDSGLSGFIVATYKVMRREFGASMGLEEMKEKAKTRLEQEVRTLNDFMTGEVRTGLVYMRSSGEVLDSLSGIYPDADGGYAHGLEELGVDGTWSEIKLSKPKKVVYHVSITKVKPK